MIIGTGSDLIDIRRVEKTLARFGDRFIKRCFTEIEQAKAERRRDAGTHIATYAKRFAAKEACSKALGTGFGGGVYMKDIGVVNTQAGKPILALTGGAKKRLDTMIPKGMKPVIHVTITDEAPMAHVLVIIEAV
ncbi:MAG: holo-ACP synthase [Alphaproteobacteria bacterium]